MVECRVDPWVILGCDDEGQGLHSDDGYEICREQYGVLERVHCGQPSAGNLPDFMTKVMVNFILLVALQLAQIPLEFEEVLTRWPRQCYQLS